MDIYGCIVGEIPVTQRQANLKEDEELVLEVNNSDPNAPVTASKYTGGKKPRPEKTKSKKGDIYIRDAQIARNALDIQKYKCQIDPEHRTFIRKSTGKNYVEPHHLVPMGYQKYFEYSLDREENTVALCSHCHNEIHYGRDAKKLIEKLYQDRKDLLKGIGVEVSLKELKKMYK